MIKLLLPVFIILSVPVFGQNCSDELEKDYTLKNGKTRYMHPATLSNVTASLLSNFTLGYNGFGANSANGSINVSGGETQVSVTTGFFSRKSDRWFFTVNTNAQIDEGVTSIASGGKINGGYSFDLGFNYRFAYSAFYMNETSCKQRLRGELSKEEIGRIRQKYLLQAGIVSSLRRATDNSKLYDERGMLILALNNSEKLSESQVDSIGALIDKIDKKLAAAALAACDKDCDIFLDSLIAFEKNLIKPNPLSVHWVRANLLYGREQYSALDSTKYLLSDQLYEISYDKKGLALSYNYLFKGRYFTFYLNASVGYLYNNSFLGKSKVSLADNFSVTDSTGQKERVYSKDSKVYNTSKEPYEEFHSVQNRLSFQIFVGENRNFGFDLSTQLSMDRYSNRTDGVWDAQLGLMYSNAKSDALTSRYTIQLLFKANDLTTVKIPDNNTFGKKLDVSLRFAVPFSNFFL